MDLKIKALSPKIGTDIPLPYYATPGSAAMDLHACLDGAVTIPAGERRVIPTGLAIALPSADYVALVFARSGLGIKHGVAPANCVGVIDSDYRGELIVPLRNFGDKPYTVQPGERIAQLDEQEPEDMEAPEYEVWADQHEALEDLTDEIRDLLDGMGGNA